MQQALFLCIYLVSFRRALAGHIVPAVRPGSLRHHYLCANTLGRHAVPVVCAAKSGSRPKPEIVFFAEGASTTEKDKVVREWSNRANQWVDAAGPASALGPLSFMAKMGAPELKKSAQKISTDLAQKTAEVTGEASVPKPGGGLPKPGSALKGFEEKSAKEAKAKSFTSGTGFGRGRGVKKSPPTGPKKFSSGLEEGPVPWYIAGEAWERAAFFAEGVEAEGWTPEGAQAVALASRALAEVAFAAGLPSVADRWSTAGAVWMTTYEQLKGSIWKKPDVSLISDSGMSTVSAAAALLGFLAGSAVTLFVLLRVTGTRRLQQTGW
eukprot:gnl/TRDRNA2_/TRDRNA2_165210_c0_seq2.p1 gnl/TRDRNA2_/TRDRNA2_165210_c0~~gnl/TRDRNA2_/TRDRNA2_165210_c0_seq2.p1  ORF type:complete len:323 (-),score=46.16 gnl/TRDRNA2_/TRDRNA2_165210_c0_seq2:94-1062(-)